MDSPKVRLPSAGGPLGLLLVHSGCAGITYAVLLARGLDVVHHEAHGVRARVVADGVELPLACGRQLHVECGVQDAVAVPQRLGARHVVAGRVHHAAAAAVDHLWQSADFVRGAQVRRVVVAHDVRGTVHHVAAALDCDVLHRGLPLRVAVGVGREVDADALLVQRRACERHEVLPADERAHGTPRRLAHGEEVVLRIAPHQVLRPGGLELAVQRVEAPLGREDHVAVIEGAGRGIAL